MVYLFRRARALLLHWLIQLGKLQSLSLEYIVGWLRAMLWVPVLPWIYWIRKRLNKPGWENKVSGPELVAPLALTTRYINLRHRKDRNHEARLELSGIGFANFERFEAFQHSQGALGCALSHLAVLEDLARSDAHVAFICEDDIEFVGEASQLEMVLADFLARSELDVLCLSFRLRGPALPISPHLALANNIQTTAGYVVKRSAYAALIESFRGSAEALESGVPLEKASIDVRWKTLQYSRLLFCIPRMPVARQRESLSDIVGKMKFYG